MLLRSSTHCFCFRRHLLNYLDVCVTIMYVSFSVWLVSTQRAGCFCALGLIQTSLLPASYCTRRYPFGNGTRDLEHTVLKRFVLRTSTACCPVRAVVNLICCCVEYPSITRTRHMLNQHDILIHEYFAVRELTGFDEGQYKVWSSHLAEFFVVFLCTPSIASRACSVDWLMPMLSHTAWRSCG